MEGLDKERRAILSKVGMLMKVGVSSDAELSLIQISSKSMERYSKLDVDVGSNLVNLSDDTAVLFKSLYREARELDFSLMEKSRIEEDVVQLRKTAVNVSMKEAAKSLPKLKAVS